MIGRLGSALALLAALAAALAFAGCGDDDRGSPPAPTGGFADALGEVSTGPIPLGVGFGYIDLTRLGPADAEWAAGALGPGGSALIANRAEIARRTGFDVTSANRLLSVAASYTLGVRADGVDPEIVRRALGRAADARASGGQWEHLDFGIEWSVPNGTPAQSLSGMGARIALGPDAVVVARTNRARAELTTRSDEILTDPAVRAVLACLEDPAAARIVPNNFTHATNIGPQLLAFGVSDPADPPVVETLCAADPDPELVDETVGAMETTLSLDATDTVTGAEIGSIAAEVEVDDLDEDGASVARTRLTLAPGQEPGHFFGAFVHGSLITYLGLAPPRPE